MRNQQHLKVYLLLLACFCLCVSQLVIAKAVCSFKGLFIPKKYYPILFDTWVMLPWCWTRNWGGEGVQGSHLLLATSTTAPASRQPSPPPSLGLPPLGTAPGRSHSWRLFCKYILILAISLIFRQGRRNAVQVLTGMPNEDLFWSCKSKARGNSLSSLD